MDTSWPREAFYEVFDDLLKASPYRHESDLAQASGVSHATLSSWRSGRQRPSTKNLAKIARVLGVTSIELWELAGLIEPGSAERLGIPGPETIVHGTAALAAGAAFDATVQVVPNELVRLLDLYGQMESGEQENLRAQLRVIIGLAEGVLSRSTTQE